MKSLVAFALCCIFCSLHAKPLQLDIHAKSAILINADTGAVLFEKNSHTSSYPASITKIATALYVLEAKKADLSKAVTVSSNALKMKPIKRDWSKIPPYWLEMDGTKMNLMVGEEVSIESLLHGLMLISANDAANVLAESTSGSIPAFVDELNAYLKTIGCQNTHFCSPHGLHCAEHVTTAYDMALITKKAMQNPTFREIVAKRSYSKPATNKNPSTEMKQHNHLLLSGRFFYAPTIGVKTGYTSQAMNTLVAAAKQDGRTLITVVLGCNKREDRYSDAKALFEAAFGEKKIRRTMLTEKEIYTRSVEGAKSQLRASLSKELAIEYFPAEESVAKAQIHWTIPSFPIRQGAIVGELDIIDANGALLNSAPLFAKEEVNAEWLFILKDWWRHLFGSSDKGSANPQTKELPGAAMQKAPV